MVLFKQKTAYEMRSSDWSSDVCSSDLRTPAAPRRQAGCRCNRTRTCARGSNACVRSRASSPRRSPIRSTRIPRATCPSGGTRLSWERLRPRARAVEIIQRHLQQRAQADVERGLVEHELGRVRSEEHTSELQSLMRISYAVF